MELMLPQLSRYPDLDATLDCLDAISQVPDQGHRFREALWESEIVHFVSASSAYLLA
jgi:hypothetical protein